MHSHFLHHLPGSTHLIVWQIMHHDQCRLRNSLQPHDLRASTALRQLIFDRLTVLASWYHAQQLLPFQTASIMCEPLQRVVGPFVLVYRATAEPPALWIFRHRFGFQHAEHARNLHQDGLWPGPALKAQYEIELLDQNRRSSPSCGSIRKLSQSYMPNPLLSLRNTCNSSTMD